MIFLTLGTQLPFDRLVKAVDDWCGETGYNDVTAQIIVSEPDGYHPLHFDWVTHLEPGPYAKIIEAADVIVAHAGMGSIITAMTYTKPIILLPRKAGLGEHRNDHQVATAQRFRNHPGICVADTEKELPALLEHMAEGGEVGNIPVPEFADEKLIAAIRDVVVGDG